MARWGSTVPRGGKEGNKNLCRAENRLRITVCG
jgi:hypothetical protein